MTARAFTTPLSVEPMFRFFDYDVSNLTALALHLEEVGRRGIAEETNNLARRVRSGLELRGVVPRHLFAPADFARLMNMTKYAAEVSDVLRAAIRDLAERIWCGLTGDEVCPIKIDDSDASGNP